MGIHVCATQPSEFSLMTLSYNQNPGHTRGSNSVVDSLPSTFNALGSIPSPLKKEKKSVDPPNFYSK